MLAKCVAAALCAALGSAALLAAAPAADAAPMRARVSSVTFAGPELLRVDRQDEPLGVVVSGASGPVTVDFGDGSDPLTQASRCSLSRARTAPSRCSLTFSHVYETDGLFTQVVRAGSRQVGSRQVHLAAKPVAWTPPAGFTPPPGWSLLDSGATFTPCESVDWFFDHAGEPADRVGMLDDVHAALDQLSTVTGLHFVEAPDAASAQMLLEWGDTGSSSALGGGRDGYAQITFSPTAPWTKDEWKGAAFVTREWDADGRHWTWTLPGRTWLVAHEAAHGLGLGHVADPSQLMNPIAGEVAGFGPGDLDALSTMYLSQPCPVIPD